MAEQRPRTDRHGVTRIEAVRPPLGTPRWPLLTIRILAALGVIVTAYLTFLHYQAGTAGAIESPFCGQGTVINCNTVLGSGYGRLFGQPVALWAALTYAAVLGLSFLPQFGLLILLCGWTFAFSLYLASVSFFVIKAACLFCLTLYAISTGLLVGAVALARSTAAMTMRQTLSSLAGYAVLIVGFGWWQAQAMVTSAPPTPNLHASVPLDMEYVRFYNSRPQVTLRGAERHTKGSAQAALTISEFVDFR
jgi:uncharacterized membrane protein